MEPQLIDLDLEPAELGYVLNLLDAKSLFGSERQVLFPADPVAKQTLLAEGASALTRNNWLIDERPAPGKPTANGTTNGSEAATIDPTLMLMVAAAADPQLVVLTHRYLDQRVEDRAKQLIHDQQVQTPSSLQTRRRQTITHYIAGDGNLDSDAFPWKKQEPIVIEQARRANGHYHLASLPIVDLISQRIAALWEEQTEALANQTSAAPFSLPAELCELRSIDKSQLHGADGQLEQLLKAWGLPTEARNQFTGILTSGELMGEIQIRRVAGQRTLAGSTITLIRFNKLLWMVTDRSAFTDFQPITPSELEQHLRETIHKLNDIRYEEQIPSPSTSTSTVYESALQ